MPATAAQRPLGVQIAHRLKAHSVDTVFGIPGVHNLELYRGLEEAGIAHVLARHEQGAGFMADGYARATGQPGVVFTISGPGVTNALTALGQAWSDSVPILLLASCLDETAARRGQLHQMRDQEEAGRSACDWSETARDGQAALALIDRAMLEFASRRKRPKALHLPIELLSQPVEMPKQALAIASPPMPDPASVEAAAARLRAASRPLFILGGGVLPGIAARGPGFLARLRGLLRQTGAASFVTYAGRGLVSGDDPLHFGALLARPASAGIIASADLVIAVGTELSETDLWRHELGTSTPDALLRVDIDPEVLADLHRAGTIIKADGAVFLDLLAERMQEPRRKTGWDEAEVAVWRARAHAEIDAERPHIAPVCAALRAALPEAAMIYSDMTQFAYVAKEIWDMVTPGHWHHPTGFGTLGYALPAAIGGALARAGKPTLAIAGDYGLQFTLPELATAAELGLPLPILIWDNHGLGEIADSFARVQITPRDVTPFSPDLEALARAYGAAFAAPSSLEELQSATLKALDRPGPTVIRMTPDLAR